MDPNPPESIQQRVSAGLITWKWLLLMLAARSVFAVTAQGLVSVLFFSGSTAPWEAAGEWWMVYGTLIDIGSLALLVWLTRREGIRLFDLGNYRRDRWLKDGLLGLGLFLPIFPLLAFAPLTIALIVLYGPDVPVQQSLTGAGFLYSLIVWPVIWAVAEDSTYLGYCLPRIEALSGKTWVALVIVGFFSALQHIFLPFKLDLQWTVARLVAFVPLVIVLMLLYRRQRRLLPLHVLHWGLNFAAVLLTFLMQGATP